jgi:hypothetical protein
MYPEPVTRLSVWTGHSPVRGCVSPISLEGHGNGLAKEIRSASRKLRSARE